MRITITSKVTGLLVFALLLACPGVHTPADAMVTQRAVLISIKSKPVGGENPAPQSAKATVLAKNTNSATPPKTEATAQKTQKSEGKDTISRCWKRLMDNIREVRHAHRKK